MPQNPSAGAASAHPFLGVTLARCKVGEAIGQGRTSWVCRAHYEPLDREIAIKILSGEFAETAEIRDHFQGEARAIARLDHENVVKVLDVVEDEGHLCILMEYVAGQTLQERLTDGEPLPLKKALRIALQTARALEAAHAESVVHRDVKPANIILAAGSETVKVVDFGLAGPKALANRAGTPLYMSPEACQGKRIDEKSDVYALGVCLYQMLTGKLPYTGKTVKAILQAHIAAELVPPSEVNSALGTAFDDVAKKLMIASKGYRPSAGEAVALLEPLLESGKPGGGGRGAARGGKGRRPRGAQKSGPSTGVIIAAVVGLIAVIAGVLMIMGDDPKPTDTGNGDAPSTAPETGAGAGGVSTTGGTTTTPLPKSVEDPRAAAARTAFEAVEAWAKDNPKQWEDEAGRWEIVARDHAATPHGTQAGEKATYARERAKQEAEIAERRQELAEVEARTKARRDEITAALKLFDFATAKKLAASHTNIEGETIQEWRAKRRRIGYLADEFQRRTNEGVADGRISASVVKADAGGDEVVVGVDDKGVQTKAGDLPRQIDWQFVTADAMWDLTRKFVSQSNVDGNVYLAILAAELGLAKQSSNHRQVAEMVDRQGVAKDILRDYFVD